MIESRSADSEFAIQDRALVEADIHGRAVSFRTVIVRICQTELWLGLASPDRRLEMLWPDQTVRLTVGRNGAALLAQSWFVRPLGDSRSRGFAVVRPAAVERVQRRCYVRYPIDLPIRYSHVDPATWEPRGRPATTVTRNLSPGGTLFVSDAAVKVGDNLDLALPLSGGDRVSMNGVVKRLGRAPDDSRSGPNDRPDHAEVAVEFTRITSLDQDRIVRIILLAEHRRREAAQREQPYFA